MTSCSINSNSDDIMFGFPPCQWMEGRLLGTQTVEQREREKEIGALAVLHCSEARARLKQCFRDSLVGWCSREQAAFWDCFNKVRTEDPRTVNTPYGGPSYSEHTYSGTPKCGHPEIRTSC